MALSNLDKDVTTRLFQMIIAEDKITEEQIRNIKTDSCTYSQLKLIYKQIENLKEEAKQILTEHVQTTQLNNIICNFKKVPGTLYYLYIKENNWINETNKFVKILSLVPPEYDSSGKLISHIYTQYLGSYFYDYDLKFKEVSNDLLC
jgi:hypothetical protein